ncbi:sensor histidine kinase [Phycicoccus sonneratiae]|uniref:Sensor histidine kinase n=1 Tax=Phycicoccus sonneratiae TaxID=2807628 RepID=A0ABS2CR03_9MICO|nr:sensor histidine kinase [Phycicoccus sonneraticus]MBM6402220.1 sensor histidine kinase [Phycicoccus sonneraticus]
MPPPVTQHSWPRLPRGVAAVWSSLWALGLLAPPLVSSGASPHPLLVVVGLVATGVLFVAATVDATARSGTRRTDLWPLVVALLLLVGLLALDPALDWSTLPVLAAIAVGATTPLRATPSLVAGLAAVVVLVARARGADWPTAIWGTGVTTALAGLLTWAFGWLAAVVAELRATREELASTAVAAERLRFSRDLHDLLGHSLSVVSVKAQAARRTVRSDPDAAEQHTDDIATLAQEALTEVRRAVRGYRGTTLDDELVRAGQALRAAGIRTEVERADAGLTPSEEELLAWVVREGATNVLRHARAGRAAIRTATGPEGTTLVIEDDGSGPDADEDASAAVTGSGLAGLRERLTGSGGSLHTDGDAAGFRLSVRLPPGGGAR